jgi:Zn-dependent protease
VRDLEQQIILYGALVVAVILHEISHGVMALAYGDDTAKRAGRLTLNPLPHLDPVGSILLPAMAVLANLPVLGWAKPVPVNPARMRNPRANMLVVGLVGPGTNFALMLGAAFWARSLWEGGDVGRMLDVAWSFALINLFLGVFNMLPIPPLDGSSLIERVLPARALPGWHRFRPYGFLVLFAGLFMFDIFGRIIHPFAEVLERFVFGG